MNLFFSFLCSVLCNFFIWWIDNNFLIVVTLPPFLTRHYLRAPSQVVKGYCKHLPGTGAKPHEEW